MKNRSLLFSIVIFATVFTCHAQVNIGSLGFNYSALVRDTAGRVQPLKAVKLRFTLLLGQNGTIVNSPWIEMQNTTTDAYGFVNVTIGNGTRAGGTAASFSGVDFTLSNYWILIEVFNSFTSVYDPLAKQPLQAVPYAKVAGSLVGGQIIPSGTIVAFGGDVNKIPEGWMLCDGRSLNNNDPRYQSLFNAIQYNWGSINHSDSFYIPFTLGLFLRGAGGDGNYDPDAAIRQPSRVNGNAGNLVGSFQEDEFKSHDHGVLNAAQTANGNDAYVPALNGPVPGSGQAVRNSGGSETRPKNVYVNYIIKL